MFAIAFDMTVADLRKHCPKGIAGAYTEIAKTMAPFGFERVQGSVYIGKTANLAGLYDAVTALKALAWFPICASDVRAFKVEDWSDLTASIKPSVKR
jgi:virulence-associated protein VapD